MPYTERERQLAYQREWNRRYYKANRKRERARILARKQQIADWLASQKANLSCMRCGECEPVCLDFHHRKGEQKDFNLGYVKAWGWGRKRIEAEMKKCIVLCSNCHRKEHSKK